MFAFGAAVYPRVCLTRSSCRLVSQSKLTSASSSKLSQLPGVRGVIIACKAWVTECCCSCWSASKSLLSPTWCLYSISVEGPLAAVGCACGGRGSETSMLRKVLTGGDPSRPLHAADRNHGRSRRESSVHGTRVPSGGVSGLFYLSPTRHRWLHRLALCSLRHLSERLSLSWSNWGDSVLCVLAVPSALPSSFQYLSTSKFSP